MMKSKSLRRPVHKKLLNQFCFNSKINYLYLNMFIAFWIESFVKKDFI